MKYLLLIILIQISDPLRAGDTLVLEEPVGKWQLWQHMDILEDASGHLGLEDLISESPGSSWHANQQKEPNLGFTQSHYWIRINFKNNLANEERFLLEVMWPQLDSVQFYLVEDRKKVLDKACGTELIFASRDIEYPNCVFSLSLANASKYQVFLRIRTHAPMKFPLTLWQAESFAEEKIKSSSASFLYYGFMIVMVFYNSFLFFSTRKANYLFYIAYITSIILLMTSLDGVAKQYLWPNAIWWGKVSIPFFIGMSLFWITAFLRSFLETQETAPRFNLALLIMQAIMLCMSLSALLLEPQMSAPMVTIASVIAIALLFALLMIKLVERSRPARFILIAFLPLSVGALLFSLRSLGLKSFDFLGSSADLYFQLGTAAEVVLLSLALADWIKEEQKKARRKIESLNKGLQLRLHEIENLNAEVIEKEKARTNFFHNTSHELRTPLNGIMAFVSLLRDEHYGPIPEKALRQLQKVEQLSKTLLMQVNTILDLAKSRKGELKIINSQISLTELLEEAQVLAEGLARACTSQEVSFDISHEWPETARGDAFNGDKEKLATIIRNLLGNAFKFSDKSRENHVHLQMKLDQERNLQLVVADTGIGIAQNDHALIFEEFRQAQEGSTRAYEGSGLGLTMVRDIVNQMGGQLELHSELGSGSKFIVRIPEANVLSVSMDKPEEDSPPNKEHSSQKADRHPSLVSPPEKAHTRTNAARNDRHILVIDDNEVNCEVFCDILTTAGYDACSAIGGRKGLELAAKKKPDLILLDLMMPDFSGEDVLKELRSNSTLAEIPVILVTARASQEDRVLGLNMGADDYLAKPIIRDEMIVRIKNTLDRLDYTRVSTEKHVLEKNLAAAQEIRGSISGENLNVPQVMLAEYYKPVEMTSGDWLGINYDADLNRIYILIGDVTGHGIISSLLTLATTAAARGVISGLKHERSKVSMKESGIIIAKAINDAIKDTGAKIDRHSTMALISLDLSTGEGVYFNAGHNAVHLISEDKVKSILKPGTPLGLQDDPIFGIKEFKMMAGDSLFLFTDGLIENQGPDGEMIEGKRLKKILSTGGNANHIKKRITDEILLTWKDSLPEDDCTFLVVQWTPQGESQHSDDAA